MPDPQSPEPPDEVTPVAPDEPHPADHTDPGEMAEIAQQQRETKTGKYGEQKAKTHKPASEENKDKTHWIEVVMIDDAGDPVPGMPVDIEVPSGEVSSGTTDDKGLIRVDGIDPGSCKITFPTLDKDAWEPA